MFKFILHSKDRWGRGEILELFTIATLTYQEVQEMGFRLKQVPLALGAEVLAHSLPPVSLTCGHLCAH